MSSNQDLPMLKKQERKPREFRKDIQGLRAIAVGIVVLYHFWGHYLPGGFVGVDVFFVISGFLITSHLVSQPPRNLADVGRFWMRRVKRLIPASFLVIFCSVLGIWVFAPETVWQDWGLQAVAATFYFQNWFLALTKVDYLAEGDAPSPFQHFWSLSTEEQFYFVWPILIGLLVVAALKSKKVTGPVVIAGISLVFLLSIGYSLYATSTNPGGAYFSTFTRAWEFSAGALVAAMGAKAHSPKSDIVSLIGSWGGVLAIVFSAFAFTGDMPFPGYIAMIPVFGTALILLTNSTHKYSPNIFLGTKLFQFFGDNSYALYLWHWPLLVLVPFMVEDFKWPQKFLALALALILSVLTQKLVEVRFRELIDSSHLLTAPRFLTAGSLILTLFAGAFYMTNTNIAKDAKDIDKSLAQVERAIGKECFGASALTDACGKPEAAEPSDQQVAPAPIAAKSDKPAVYPDDCFASDKTNFKDRPVCHYGKGKIKVALVGNSHAGQWFPALDSIAKKNDWQIDTYLASRCAIMGKDQEFADSASSKGCGDLGPWVTSQFKKNDYDLVITANRQSVALTGQTMKSSKAPATKAYEKTLKDWSATGAEVVVLRDTAFPGATIDSAPDCVAANSEHVSECSGSADTWIPMDPQYDAAQKLNDPKISTVDMNDQLCEDGRCYTVIGGVLAYWDHSHLTATYSELLANTLGSRIEKSTDAKQLFITQ